MNKRNRSLRVLLFHSSHEYLLVLQINCYCSIIRLTKKDVLDAACDFFLSKELVRTCIAYLSFQLFSIHSTIRAVILCI